MRAERSANGVRSQLSAWADVKGEFENDVRVKDQGHAWNDNNSGRSVNVWVGCMGTSSCLSPSIERTVERGVGDAGTEEESKGCKEDTREYSWKRTKQWNKSRARWHGETHASRCTGTAQLYNRVRGIVNSERGLNLHLDATATMCMVNRRGLDRAKHVDMQNMWIQDASMSKRFVTYAADLMAKPPAGQKIVQLMRIIDYEFVGQSSRQEELYGMK